MVVAANSAAGSCGRPWASRARSQLSGCSAAGSAAGGTRKTSSSCRICGRGRCGRRSTAPAAWTAGGRPSTVSQASVGTEYNGRVDVELGGQTTTASGQMHGLTAPDHRRCIFAGIASKPGLLLRRHIPAEEVRAVLQRGSVNRRKSVPAEAKYVVDGNVGGKNVQVRRGRYMPRYRVKPCWSSLRNARL